MENDFFSEHATLYSLYRPHYPGNFIYDLSALKKYKGVAWDCACGNGQLAVELSKYFHLVCASDISETQIASAPPHKGILYSAQPSEKTDFPDHFFDLVIVGQAIHWLDVEAFYTEVNRVLETGGIMALAGYGLIKVNDAIDDLVSTLYFETLQSFIPKERDHILNGFKDLSFPFETIEMPAYQMEFQWDFYQFTGFLKTWSAVKKYEALYHSNPIHQLEPALKKAWGIQQLKKVSFPFFTRVGKKII